MEDHQCKHQKFSNCLRANDYLNQCPLRKKRAIIIKTEHSVRFLLLRFVLLYLDQIKCLCYANPRKVKYKNNIMNDYLVDENVLGAIVDALIAQKQSQTKLSDEEITNLRTEGIQKLNQNIEDAFFSQLSDEQIDELHELLQQDDVSQDDLNAFFSNNGVDLKQTIEQVIKNFSQEFVK